MTTYPHRLASLDYIVCAFAIIARAPLLQRPAPYEQLQTALRRTTRNAFDPQTPLPASVRPWEPCGLAGP